MKILLAIEGSPCSQAAVDEVTRRPWPPTTEVRILSVAHTAVPDASLFGSAIYDQLVENERQRTFEEVAKAAKQIQAEAPNLRVSSKALEGSPKKAIVREAEDWGADLIVLVSHGYGPIQRFLLGSVAHAVALHAHCSVEIVRCRHRLATLHETGKAAGEQVGAQGYL